MFGESKNTEWEEAVIHLRKFVEELVEVKVNKVLYELGPNQTRIVGRERGFLSQ